jgi:hypothetical protein
VKYKKWLLIGIPGALLVFTLATAGKVLAQGAASELAKILEAGLDGFQVYLNWLLEVLKVIW